MTGIIKQVTRTEAILSLILWLFHDSLMNEILCVCSLFSQVK